MIRRDYILRMIEEFIRALARITSLKQGQRWAEAEATTDEEFHRLIGLGAADVSRLTDTDLLARLVQNEPTHAVRERMLILTRLLMEAGELAAAQHRREESRQCYLRALQLLLQVLARGEVSETPEFVPRVEAIVAALAEAPLPARTSALLMLHYERTGAFAKAEDALFAMLETEPADPSLIDFGVAFYQRLLGQADRALAEGDLPRAEVEAGLAELRGRQARPS